MRTVEVNIYKFDELSDKAKERIIIRFRESNDMPFFSEELNEILKALLNENKIEILGKYNFYYSLSHSQGDGVCFVGEFKYKGYKMTITHQGNYYHYKSINIQHESYDEEDNSKIMWDGEFRSVDDEFRSIYKNICNEIEKIGYDIIDHENSEECIKENIESNGYEFFNNGDIYHV